MDKFKIVFETKNYVYINAKDKQNAIEKFYNSEYNEDNVQYMDEILHVDTFKE